MEILLFTSLESQIKFKACIKICFGNPNGVYKIRHGIKSLKFHVAENQQYSILKSIVDKKYFFEFCVMQC